MKRRKKKERKKGEGKDEEKKINSLASLKSIMRNESRILRYGCSEITLCLDPKPFAYLSHAARAGPADVLRDPPGPAWEEEVTRNSEKIGDDSSEGAGW